MRCATKLEIRGAACALNLKSYSTGFLPKNLDYQYSSESCLFVMPAITECEEGPVMKARIVTKGFQPN